jgi:hypothetical protein
MQTSRVAGESTGLVLDGRRRAGRFEESDMKHLRSLVLPLACVLAVVAMACGGKESGGRPSGGKESGGSAEARVGKFKLGHDIGKDGEAVSEGRTFAKGDKVYVSFAILDAPRGAQARVDWIAKPGGKRAEEIKPLPGGDGVVSFTADTKDWEAGTYTVETWIVESGPHGTRRLGNADFSLGNSSAK